MRRIITAQGSMPLLNVLSVLEHEKQTGLVRESEDTLIIGGLYNSNIDAAKKTANVCEQMARIWPFKKVYFLQNLESLIAAGALSFEQAVSTLQNQLGINQAHSVYVGRNWQLFNELVLNAISAKEIRACGDALGYLDIDQPQFGRVFSPKGLKRVDCASLITPIEGAEGLFQSCAIHQVDPFAFATVISKVGAHIDGLLAFCENLRTQLHDAATLLITAYDFDAGISSSLDDEITAYCNLVQRELSPGSPLIIKGHPRQASGQAEKLVARLNTLGYPTFSLTQFNQVPIEVFSSLIPIGNVLACNSYAAISLAYLIQCPITMSFGESELRKSLQAQWHDPIFEGERIRIRGIKQAYTEKFEPIYFKDWKYSSTPPSKEPVHFLPLPRPEGKSPLTPLSRAVAAHKQELAQGKIFLEKKLLPIQPLPPDFQTKFNLKVHQISQLPKRIKNLFIRRLNASKDPQL